jgi:hypothetical protein
VPTTQKQTRSSHHQSGKQDERMRGLCISNDLIIQGEPELRAIAPLICQLDTGIRRDEHVDEVDARLGPVRVHE